MNRIRIIETGILGLMSTLGSHAFANTEAESLRAIEDLGRSQNPAIRVDPLVGNTCYGLPCPGSTTDDACDNTVIQNNLAKLRELNIVSATALAPFACTGYCFSNTPEGRQKDKCDKAEALKLLVEQSENLRVDIKF